MYETNEEWSEYWDRFIAMNRPEIGFMQSSWWIDLMGRNGFEYLDAFYFDAAGIIAGAKVLIGEFEPGRFFFYIPDGPILSPDEVTASEQLHGIIAHLDRHRRDDPSRRYSHVRLEPKWTSKPEFAASLTEIDGWFEPRSTVYVDLKASEQEILARMKYNGRYRIKKAASHGIEIAEDSSDAGTTDFLAIYRDTAERKRFNSMSDEFLIDLMRVLFDKRLGSLFFAEYRGKRIAAALVVFFGERATYFFAGSLGEYRDLMAPYLLNYRIMLQAKARGFKWYDLYGVAPNADPEHIWAGISVFKRNLGGIDVHYIPALDYIYDREIYQAYQRSIGG